MKRVPAVFSTSVILLGIWLSLTLSTDVQEIVLGVVVSVLVAVATHGALTGNLFRLLKPRKLIAAIGYVLYLLGQMVKANIDVFFRIFRPVIPLKPGIVKVNLRLKSERAKVIVANSITLTPGTITIDIVGDHIFVHWIFLPDGDVHAETQSMVDGFAGRLEKIFE
ncbi:MAG: Na+/H+ antiporter subunit E [Candidatus Fermentibacteraceae bacterium]|nr:Na+/H+ antiporter subunit E [Candidatus Fermentibacteraceae bacterium]